MSFWSTISLTAGVFHILLTLFVLSRDLRSVVNRVYALWGCSLVLWNLSWHFDYKVALVNDEVTGRVLTQLLHFGVIFLPVTNFHLYLLIARVSRPLLLRVLYLLHASFAISVFTPFYMRSVRWTPFGYYADPGPMLFLFAVDYFIIAVTTIVLLYLKQRTLRHMHRTRMRALLGAYIILFVAGTHDFIPIFAGLTNPAASAVFLYPGTSLPFQPWGNLAAIVYGVVVAYTVLQHQLLDIHLTLSHVAAQLVRILFMVFVGFLLLVALYGSAKTQFTPFSFFGALGVLLLTALLTSVLFPRFFGKGDEKLERRILGDRFEYHDQIRGFIQSVQYYTEVDALMKDVHSLLAHTVKVRSYHIILLDETTRAFALTQSFPDRPQAQLASLRGNSPVFEFFQRTQAECLACGMTYATPGETPSERSAREQIAEFQAEFCFPFLFDQGFLGLLLIGEKVSGEPYTAHDLNLLILLARNLSRTIYQLRLKKQVRLAEELELLGRMSRGMAHDLNNLLVPVSTLLQLCGDTAAHRTHIQELLPIAIRNLATMQAYIREALFFSQHHTPQIAPGRLDLLLHKAAELAEPKLQRRKVEVVISSEEYITVEMDSVLIQRLISNILSNAIDASAPGSKVFLELRLLARTEQRRDWLRLRVIDHGDGISPENLARIASPYFTTKDKGDETRGFGLGLSICRKIVHIHGGTLRIFSEEKKGTMVQVDLPSRHIKTAPTLMAVAT